METCVLLDVEKRNEIVHNLQEYVSVYLKNDDKAIRKHLLKCINAIFENVRKSFHNASYEFGVFSFKLGSSTYSTDILQYNIVDIIVENNTIYVMFSNNKSYSMLFIADVICMFENIYARMLFEGITIRKHAIEECTREIEKLKSIIEFNEREINEFIEFNKR